MTEAIEVAVLAVEALQSEDETATGQMSLALLDVVQQRSNTFSAGQRRCHQRATSDDRLGNTRNRCTVRAPRVGGIALLETAAAKKKKKQKKKKINSSVYCKMYL